MPRQPWRQLKAVPAPAGHGVVYVEKGRGGPQSASSYGRACERTAAAWLRKQRFREITISHLSRGASDLVATDDTRTVRVQVKATSDPARVPAAVLACAHDMDKMPHGCERWGLVYLRNRGRVVLLKLTDAGYTVEGAWNGSQEFVEPARAALARRRTKTP